MQIFHTLLKLKKFVILKIMGDDFRKHEIPISDQKKIIMSFPEPSTLIERSFFQYLCQNKRFKSISYLILKGISNVGAAIFLIVLFPFARGKAVRPPKEQNIAVFIGDERMMDRMPKSLNNKYHIILDKGGRLLLTKEVKRMTVKIWKRYPLHFRFILKNMIKMGYYSSLISRYRPDAIICTSEDSYTSSVLTLFCKQNHIKHINIMHGEMSNSLPRAFCGFHEFYIWDAYYCELLKRLRCGGDFIIEVPASLIYSKTYQIKACLKYYLQDQNKNQMIEIKRILERMTDNYKVRPHPIWTDMNLVKMVFEEQYIEYPKDCNIEYSIMSSEYLISYDSTVLFQGYLNKKKIIVDDVTNPKLYLRNIEAEYIILQKKECILLSNFITMA